MEVSRFVPEGSQGRRAIFDSIATRPTEASAWRCSELQRVSCGTVTRSSSAWDTARDGP